MNSFRSSTIFAAQQFWFWSQMLLQAECEKWQPSNYV